MSRRIIRLTCTLTTMFILLTTIFPVIPCSFQTALASAAGFKTDDIYKGLGIALILILLSKLGQSRENISNEDIKVSENIRSSNSDLELLARLINGESRGEPYNGQVAVGAVVLNRVKSPGFPNTIREVIYQDKQFSCVDDGQINLNPSDSSYQAALDALNGEDPSLGALFFYNPKKAKTMWWLSQRETTVIIGDHVFAK